MNRFFFFFQVVINLLKKLYKLDGDESESRDTLDEYQDSLGLDGSGAAQSVGDKLDAWNVVAKNWVASRSPANVKALRDASAPLLKMLDNLRDAFVPTASGPTVKPLVATLLLNALRRGAAGSQAPADGTDVMHDRFIKIASKPSGLQLHNVRSRLYQNGV